MKLIVGLGNPGPQYVLSRHNVGWWVIDHLVDVHRLGSGSDKLEGHLWGPVQLFGEKVCLLKPLTYMNLSGQSVGAVCRFYKIDPQDLLIVYDDIALPPGRLRFREKGSAGGHNGVKSIIAHLGTDVFPRMKIGVGAQQPGADLAHHVLAAPSRSERDLIEKVCHAAADFIKLWIESVSYQQLCSLVNGLRIND